MDLDQLEQSKINVREMNEGDIQSLRRIYSESFEIDVPLDIEFRNNIYVVSLENKIVGMCTIDYIDDVFVSKKIAFINSVCVSKDYRNKGVATFLLKRVEKIAKNNGATQLMLTSSDKRKQAIRLYKNLGFEVYKTNVFKKNF